VAASLMELGAMTAFLYLVMIRDYIYEHLAELTGARVTYSYGRIGGLARDLPDGWLTRLARSSSSTRCSSRAFTDSWTATASSSTAPATSA
jgi:NADH:ubiquinone oxidoreductase subunit D